MGIISSLKNLISPSAALLCPRCEKPLDGHNAAACERRMSRRYFFGAALGGVAAAVAVAQVAPVLESGMARVLPVQMRTIHRFDGEYLSRIDILYGMKVLKPEYAVRIIS